jgi:hypothetical protein
MFPAGVGYLAVGERASPNPWNLALTQVWPTLLVLSWSKHRWYPVILRNFAAFFQEIPNHPGAIAARK